MLTSGDSEGHKKCEALWEKPAQETKNPSCARKRPSNQEQTDFPKFQLFVILTSLSANISQNYVWKMLFIEQLLSHKLLFNQHAVLPQIHILETSCLGGETLTQHTWECNLASQPVTFTLLVMLAIAP